MSTWAEHSAEHHLVHSLLSSAVTRSGLSLREIGRRAGTSHATLGAYIRGQKSPSMATLTRVIEACDLAIDWQLRPRVRRHNGLARGEELAQVLRLAEQFPSNPVKEPNFPQFPRVPHSERTSGLETDAQNKEQASSNANTTTPSGS